METYEKREKGRKNKDRFVVCSDLQKIVTLLSADVSSLFYRRKLSERASINKLIDKLHDYQSCAKNGHFQRISFSKVKSLLYFNSQASIHFTLLIQGLFYWSMDCCQFLCQKSPKSKCKSSFQMSTHRTSAKQCSLSSNKLSDIKAMLKFMPSAIKA